MMKPPDTSNSNAQGVSPGLIILGLMLIGLGLVAGRIHGFSFSAWHSAIDDSPHREVFLNEAKGYRSDDWIVALPHILAQRTDTPAFPVENRLIGDGHYNMRISGAAPVRDPVVLFRPQVWGYFISGDIGMAFQWWFNALGVWIAVWLVLRRLTGHDHWISVCGATALLFSPFFQAWSLNGAPTVIFACGILLALIRLWTAVSTLPILLSTVLLAWCGVALILTFNYMPYLVTLLYFVLFVFAGMVLTSRKRRAIPGNNTNTFDVLTPADAMARSLRRLVPLPSRERARVRGNPLRGTPSPHPSPVNGAPRAIKGEGVIRQTTSRWSISNGLDWLAGARWACILLAILVILGMGVYIVAGNWDTIEIIRNSDYPGRRVSCGGDQTIWHLFRGNVLSIKPPREWRDFNPCEGAAFFLVFPLVAAALIRDWWRTRKAPDALVLGIAGYILFLLIWNLAGFSETLSRWTLMNRTPPFRTLIGLGIADLLLLAVYASGQRRTSPAQRSDPVSPWVVCLLWILFHVCLGLKLSRYFPEYSLTTALMGGAFCMALGPLLYLAPRRVLPAIMMASMLTTYDFNPWARGGTAFIEENPLSRKIQALDQESLRQGRQPVWIAYGSLELPNLFRMIGSHALNGVHAYPQLELWKTLDPEGQYRTVYNRYAHVVFELPSAPEDFKIHLVQTDIVSVSLHPEHPRFAALNVDYLLCRDDQAEALDRVSKLKKIFSYAGKHIYGAQGAMGRVERSP